MITAAQKHAQRNRGTIFVEQGEVLEHETWPGDQYILRIRAPKCAAAARPGTFIHISCDEELPMRRPLSIMRAVDDWIQVLYKIVGEGLHLLARKRRGDAISLLGPIGQPFELHEDRPRTLLIGGGVGIPPMVFIAAAVGKYFIRVSISGGVEVLMRGSTDVDTKCASICCIDDGVRASRHREC